MHRWIMFVRMSTIWRDIALTHTQHILSLHNSMLNCCFFMNVFFRAFHRFLMSSPWHKWHHDGKRERHMFSQAVLQPSVKHKYQVCCSCTVIDVLNHPRSYRIINMWGIFGLICLVIWKVRDAPVSLCSTEWINLLRLFPVWMLHLFFSV